MNSSIAISANGDLVLLNAQIVENKKALLLHHFELTQEITVKTYNRLCHLSGNMLIEKDSLVVELPVHSVLTFLESSINEFSNSLYEELVSASQDAIWLDEITLYLLRRLKMVKNIEQQIQNYSA